jgi:acyl carrier protein
MIDPSLQAQLVATVRKVGRIPRDVPITAETCLVEDLRIDSLDLFAVLIAVQDRFDLEIDVEDMPDLNRLGDLVEYVAARRNAAAA